MALNTSKLRWPELGYDFKLNEMEIGTPSNGFFENSSVGLRRSQTVLATYSLKLLKIASKHLLPGSMLQTKHDLVATQQQHACCRPRSGNPRKDRQSLRDADEDGINEPRGLLSCAVTGC